MGFSLTDAEAFSSHRFRAMRRRRAIEKKEADVTKLQLYDKQLEKQLSSGQSWWEWYRSSSAWLGHGHDSGSASAVGDVILDVVAGNAQVADFARKGVLADQKAIEELKVDKEELFAAVGGARHAARGCSPDWRSLPCASWNKIHAMVPPRPGFATTRGRFADDDDEAPSVSTVEWQEIIKMLACK